LPDTLLSALPEGPFARLSALLADIQPGKPPISLAVGDPSGPVPDFVKTALHEALAGFGNYPPIAGTESWRQAAAGWLNRRFGLSIDAERDVLPLAGTREGLFSALFPFMPVSKAGGKPVVAMPNPFYQCYAAAALAAVYICSPSNPEGAVADEHYWRALFALADRHDFLVLADECYADIWFDAPPLSALSARYSGSGGLERLLSFHSLSKRSGLPGMRSGLVAGDTALIGRLRAFRNVAGPTVPGPLLAASAALWSDEAHVEANRAGYQQKMAAAERILGQRMTRPGGGFFLWLDVGNGEDFARRAWGEQGVRVLPGAYMGRNFDDGKTQENPGFSYVRVALVSNLSTILTALERLKEIL